MLPRPGTHDGVETREDSAAALLDDLTDALVSGSRADVEALAAPGEPRAARELTALRSNVRELGVVDLRMRYVDENAGRSAPGVARAARDRAWVGDVQLEPGASTATTRA